jgi:ribosome-associated protein
MDLFPRALRNTFLSKASIGDPLQVNEPQVKLETLPKAVRLAVEAAQNKKASAITVLDLSGLGTFTEYFVICTGFSTPQVQAICTEVEQVLYKELKRDPEHREGQRSSDWALLDFGGFLVHVFSEQARRYYDLERLWRMVPKLEIPDLPETAFSSSRSEAS